MLSQTYALQYIDAKNVILSQIVAVFSVPVIEPDDSHPVLFL
jgi:hypothetical protein